MSNTQHTITNAADETKGILGSVWDAVVDGKKHNKRASIFLIALQLLTLYPKGVQNAAHKAVETIQHGVEVVEEVGLSVVDTALGVKDSAIEKTSEYIEVGKEKAGEYFEAGKEKATQLSHEYIEVGKEKAGEYVEAGKEKAASLTEFATTKATEIKQVAEGYLEAGKEVAAPYIAAGKEATAPYIAAGIEKAAPYFEAGKGAVSQLAGQASGSASEVRKATEEAVAGKGKTRAAKKARVEKQVLTTHQGPQHSTTQHQTIFFATLSSTLR